MICVAKTEGLIMAQAKFRFCYDLTEMTSSPTCLLQLLNDTLVFSLTSSRSLRFLDDNFLPRISRITASSNW